MKTHHDYLQEACRYLDGYGGNALPTQLQTINVALLMAITDLIAVIEAKK